MFSQLGYLSFQDFCIIIFKVLVIWQEKHEAFVQCTLDLLLRGWGSQRSAHVILMDFTTSGRGRTLRAELL